MRYEEKPLDPKESCEHNNLKTLQTVLFLTENNYEYKQKKIITRINAYC